MKKIFTMLAIAAIVTACGGKPEKTIENLKSAATGESNASATYAKFAEKAAADSMFRVAAMFRATSAAEKIHADNHLKVLKELGVEFTPTIEDIVVGTTLENLAKAKEGEDYELTVMYPGFIEVAEQEKADKAKNSFTWAMIAEGKHSAFYQAASEVITADSTDVNAVGEWVICPVCGDTYRKSDLGSACDLCGTSAEKFTAFTF